MPEKTEKTELRDERNGIEYFDYKTAQTLKEQGNVISRRSWKNSQVITPDDDIGILDDGDGMSYTIVTSMNGKNKKYKPGKDDETAVDWYVSDKFGHT